MALADNPAYNKGRFYYDRGDMRMVGVELGVAPQSSLTEVCSEDGSPHYKPQ